ncbi:VOC family protein [uncultured Zhongshania sp.]|jgi:catechol 2,3-dioxygenase-like lactoylglutathione lyase family enzyme|uniref:VOC family protein n=1 Tax=uncultured Zhongshania sp. TaxID=1642288 RepID=UPI0030D9328D|tara:strand:+ start:155 stop:556 length:402 start_codon:yes stop_codon:yes gene_type:complete
MPLQLLSDNIEIGVVTTNISNMRRFYGDILGLKYESELKFPGGVMHRYHMGSAIVKLVSYDTPPENDVIPGGGFSAKGYRYISMGVNGLTAWFTELKAAGVEIPVDVTAFADGIGFGFLADPDGNWIEVFGVL